MTKLFLRKVFYAIGDTFFYLLGFNFALTIICAIGVQVYVRMPSAPLQALAAAVFFIPVGIVLTTLSMLYGQVSEYKSFTLKDFLPTLSECWKTGFAFFVILFIVFFFLFAAVPFYFYMMALPAFLIAAVVFWLVVLLLVALQWFLPLYYRMGASFNTCLRGAFFLFFNNAGFSIFLFGFSFLILAISFFFGFVIPGWVAVLIAQQSALRLLMFKYDESMEELLAKKGKSKSKRKTPANWGEILAEESARIGKRTLKSFFMPWKD